MTRSDEERIADIRAAAASITAFVFNDGEVQLLADPKTQSAVMYQLIKMGEAAGTVSDTGRLAYPNAPWREMVGQRNLLAHRYFTVDPLSIWNTAQKDIPALRALLGR